MFNFTYYTPTKVVFGKDTEKETGKLIKEYGGTRVLIHYGGHSAVRSGLLERIKSSLDDEGLFHIELGGVVPNPHVGLVREGIALARENNIDFILAVGGGSVIDSSKAIAYGLGNPGFDVWDLFDKKKTASGFFPLGVVLTIAAAGSEMSNSCVITNEATHQKRGINYEISRPLFAVTDPELTVTCPDYQTEAGCTDIMMHTMERYFTQGGNMELTDCFAEGLMRTVMKNAVILHTDPLNYDARAEVMWASSISHNGLTACGVLATDFASHKIEHELSGMFDVTHGAGLAAVWPSWARYVYRNCLPRFVRFAVNVMNVQVKAGMSDEDTALAGIAAVEDFYHSIGMPVNMSELGIHPTEEQMQEMARSCIEGAGGHIGAAMELDAADVLNIYHMAM